MIPYSVLAYKHNHTEFQKNRKGLPKRNSKRRPISISFTGLEKAKRKPRSSRCACSRRNARQDCLSRIASADLARGLAGSPNCGGMANARPSRRLLETLLDRRDLAAIRAPGG